MSNYYDRDGKPLSLLIWAAKFEDMSYKRVSLDTLPDGKQVSTVWLGLDHNFDSGPPLIFETMVFPKDSSEELDCERYATLAEAQDGHKAMVAKWSGGNKEAA